jgi:hypothetical protein
MRRVATVLACLLLAAAAASAQEAAAEQLLRKIGFTEAEVDQVEAIQDQSQAEIQKARAELAIAKAQLAKLLLNVDANLREVEKAVRAAMEWEVQLRMAEISRELKLRKAIGDRKWQKLVQAVRQRQEAVREKVPGRAGGEGADAAPQGDRADATKRQRARELLKELRDLLGEKD